MNKKITEENLHEFIVLEHNKEKDYSKNFEKIYKQIIDSQDHYFSMRSNVTSLFLHYIINEKISLIEFEKVVDYMYTTIDNQNLGFMFSRLFTQSTNITVKGYRKAKEMGIIAKYGEDYWYGQWDELAHTFFDHNEGEDLKLLPENKQYLFSLLKKLDKNNYDCLYESHFGFLPRVLNHSLSDLQEIIINQPLVIDKFISVLGEFAYDIDLDKKKNFIDILSNSVDNFENIFYSHVLKKVNKSGGSKKIECNMGLCRFAEAIGYTKFFEQLNKRLLSFMEDTEFKQKNTRFKDLLDNIIISLDIAFEDQIIDFDTNLINKDISLLGNGLYLVIIDTQLKHGNILSFPEDISQYLEEKINKALIEEDYNLNYFYNNSFNLPLLKDALNYNRINQLVPQKDTNKTKKKI